MPACAYCKKPIGGEVEYTVHRDGFGVGPEVPLCNTCGSGEHPTLTEVWKKISTTDIVYDPVFDGGPQANPCPTCGKRIFRGLTMGKLGTAVYDTCLAPCGYHAFVRGVALHDDIHPNPKD